MTTTHFANLFSQNTDVSVDFSTWNRRFHSNSFDVYSQQGNNIEIRHSVNRDTKDDEFIVQAMIYEYKGCWVGNQKSFGTFDNFADAIGCARRVQLSEDTLSEDGYIALMNN